MINMKNVLFLLAFFLPSLLLANLHLAPPDLKVSNARGPQAIFVDFKTADYKIEYDTQRKRATVRTEIVFNATKIGLPIFDLKLVPSKVILNGKETQSVILETKETRFRFANELTVIGKNTLIIESKLSKNTSFRRSGVKSAFWMSDLGERSFLEQYLPANLEFDQFKATFHIQLKGDSIQEHEVFTNGKVTKSANNFLIDFPDYFTASSFYFHMGPTKSFKKIQTSFNSIDGRVVPITIYGKKGKNLNLYKTRTLSILSELEKTYGKWPHQSVVIYGTGIGGGMEYAGATITSISALGHELIHSYFARGAMPARGNAGWIDEAIASWRDYKYFQADLSRLKKTKMAGYTPYKRTTDRAAYTKGRDFIAHLDQRFQSKGGMREFLVFFKDRWLFKTYLTKDFQKELELYFDTDLKNLFDTYIYGKNGLSLKEEKVTENPFHPILSEKVLNSLL